MPGQRLEQTIYDRTDPSLPQRLVLAFLAAAWLALAWWLLFGGGLPGAGRWFGYAWKPGDPVRRAAIAIGLSVYYVRLLFTEFVFLKRRVGWGEVLTIAPWLFALVLLLAVSGGANRAAAGLACFAGVALFLLGSWMNSYAEFQRHVWKERPENRGHLYTAGLFRLCRHPNYLGDLLLFSGLSLVSGAWITVVIPLLMLAGFVFFNVPVLDAHLRQKYGAAFETYARRTRRLIPFVY